MGIRVSAHHMSFPVKDLECSRRFYEQVLGLRPIPRPDLGSLGGAWYEAGACEVHLIELPQGVDVGSPPPALNPIARHAAFAVSDYDAARDHLRTSGVEVFESRKSGQMWIRDPDGHVIELTVPLKTAGPRPESQRR